MYDDVKNGRFGIVILLSTLVGGVVGWMNQDFTPWIGGGVALILLVLGHLKISSKQMFLLPHVIILMYCLQLIIAPWHVYLYPHKTATLLSHNMWGYSPHKFFKFTVLAGYAFFAGLLFFGQSREKEAEEGPSELKPIKDVHKLLDTLIIVGFLFYFVIGTRLGGLGIFLGNLRFLSIFVYIILRADGWKQRVWIVAGMQIIFAVLLGMFHQTLLWLIATALILQYRNNEEISFSRLAKIGTITVLSIMLLIAVKAQYRNVIWYGKSELGNLSVAEKLNTFAEISVHNIKERPESFAEDLWARFNQGWIVERIMQRVPRVVPYAGGATIYRSILHSPIPGRFKKYVVNEQAHNDFTYFTGHPIPNTSMGLSILGEFYANFGLSGAIYAMFFYGRFISYILMRFMRASKTNPAWLAWIPYVLLMTIKAENDFIYTITWIVKTLIIMYFCTRFLPIFKEVFFLPKKDTMQAEVKRRY